MKLFTTLFGFFLSFMILMEVVLAFNTALPKVASNHNSRGSHSNSGSGEGGATGGMSFGATGGGSGNSNTAGSRETERNAGSNN